MNRIEIPTFIVLAIALAVIVAVSRPTPVDRSWLSGGNHSQTLTIHADRS